MTTVGRLWKRLGNYGNGWATMETVGQLWKRLGNYGNGWATMATVGQLWQRLGNYGNDWATLSTVEFYFQLFRRFPAVARFAISAVQTKRRQDNISKFVARQWKNETCFLMFGTT